MSSKTQDPVFEEILKAGEESLVVVQSPNGLGDSTYRVYSESNHAALLDNADELKGFEKSLKIQKVTARLVTVEDSDWDTNWAWSLQAKTETLESYLKSAKKLKMDIALTDVIVGELTEEDLPRQKREKTIGDGLVSVGEGSGVWSGSPEDFDKMMKGMGMPGIFGTDSDDATSGDSTSATSTNRKPTADELIEAMSNGTFDGDPIEGLFEIGKALAEEGDPEDEDVDETDKEKS